MPVAESELEKIKSWQITELLTEGELIGGPGVRSGASGGGGSPSMNAGNTAAAEVSGGGLQSEIAARNLAPGNNPFSSSDTSYIYTQLISIIQELNAVFSLIEQKSFVDGRLLNILSLKLANAIKSDEWGSVSFVLDGNIQGFPVAKNGVRTAILSVLILRELSTIDGIDLDLLLAGLLHDVGKLRLPKSLTEKKGGLSEIELALMQSHVVYGYQIVRQELRCTERVGIAVLQHHERVDGLGYTQSLASTQIDLCAKIISVADAFDAMVSKKPYRNSMTGYEAMKNLMSDNSHRFDPEILKAFIKIMGIYPVGQEVLLNDGAVAKVLESRQGSPLRPLVAILKSGSGSTFSEGQNLDLLNQPNLYIVRAVAKE